MTAGAKLIDGRPALKAKQLTEYADVSRETISYWFAHADRFGFPKRHRQGRSVYVIIEDFDTWLKAWKSREDPARSRPGAADRTGDPRELIGPAGAAEVLGIAVGTFNNYVSKSLDAWERGQDGLLPKPDEVEPRGKILKRRWRRETILNFHRPGRGRPKGIPQPFPSEASRKLDMVRSLLRDAVRMSDPPSVDPATVSQALQVEPRVAARYLQSAAAEIIAEYADTDFGLVPFDDIVAAMPGTTPASRQWQANRTMRQLNAPAPVLRHKRVRYYRRHDIWTFISNALVTMRAAG